LRSYYDHNWHASLSVSEDLHNGVYSCNSKFVPWNEIADVARHYMKLFLRGAKTILWGLAQLVTELIEFRVLAYLRYQGKKWVCL